MAEDPDAKFSLVIGGPFYRLQQRLGLLGPDLLPPWTTALLLAALAWLPPAVLSVVQGTAWGEALGGRAYFLDFGAYARFLIGVTLFVLMERMAEWRVASLVGHFSDAGLVPHEARARFLEALQRADRRSSSALAEAILLGAAVALSATLVPLQIAILQASWLGTMADGEIRLAPAGWWTLLVSFPLFWFLLLRWFWRFVVWTLLLRDVARLDLRLVATHPDRSGGIGFLGLFPLTFAPLVFALSCVTASAALKEIVFGGVPAESAGVAFGGWLVLVLVIFVGPLLVFALPLARLRRQALLDYGTLACRHNRAFEAKWVHGNMHGKEALGTQDISSLADLASDFDRIRAMGIVPVGRDAVLPLLVAAALPWLGVAMTQIPLRGIVEAVVRALL